MLYVSFSRCFTSLTEYESYCELYFWHSIKHLISQHWKKVTKAAMKPKKNNILIQLDCLLIELFKGYIELNPSLKSNLFYLIYHQLVYLFVNGTEIV